jgi:hypothetical protein
MAAILKEIGRKAEEIKDPIKVPDLIEEVGIKFGEWVKNQKNEWWSKGNWTEYRSLCRWHTFHGINSLLPRGDSPAPKPMDKPAPEAEGSAARSVYDPVRG